MQDQFLCCKKFLVFSFYSKVKLFCLSWLEILMRLSCAYFLLLILIWNSAFAISFTICKVFFYKIYKNIILIKYLFFESSCCYWKVFHLIFSYLLFTFYHLFNSLNFTKIFVPINFLQNSKFDFIVLHI